MPSREENPPLRANGSRRPRRNIGAGTAWLAGIVGLLLLAALVFAVVRHPEPNAGSGPGLNVGMAVPPLSLPSTTDSQISLSAYKGKKVVLYFYEGAG